MKLNQDTYIELYAQSISRNHTTEQFARLVDMTTEKAIGRRTYYGKAHKLSFPRFKDEISEVTPANLERWQAKLDKANEERYESK